MTEDMLKYLNQLLLKVEGLHSILITDRDGVPILKASTDEAPELATGPTFLATFGMATDQGGKLGLGKNKSVVCMYSNYQVVQVNKLPVIVSFIASSKCNTGQILTLVPYIDPFIEDLKLAVADS